MAGICSKPTKLHIVRAWLRGCTCCDPRNACRARAQVVLGRKMAPALGGCLSYTACRRAALRSIHASSSKYLANSSATSSTVETLPSWESITSGEKSVPVIGLDLNRNDTTYIHWYSADILIPAITIWYIHIINHNYTYIEHIMLQFPGIPLRNLDGVRMVFIPFPLNLCALIKKVTVNASWTNAPNFCCLCCSLWKAHELNGISVL